MCRKGENIRKRKDGRWEARYIKYRDPEGKIYYGSLYGKTYGEVKDKRNKKIAEVPGYGHLVRNLGILNYQATFETVADHWKQEIRIQRTVIRIKNPDQTANPDTGKIPKTILYIGPPKTEHSNREIPLPDKLLFYAKRIRKDGSAYILSGTARCMEPRVIQRRYAALLKTCGFPPLKSMLSGISSPVAGWNMASIPSPCPKYLDIPPCEPHWICMCISRRKRNSSI